MTKSIEKVIKAATQSQIVEAIEEWLHWPETAHGVDVQWLNRFFTGFCRDVAYIDGVRKHAQLNRAVSPEAWDEVLEVVQDYTLATFVKDSYVKQRGGGQHHRDFEILIQGRRPFKVPSTLDKNQRGNLYRYLYDFLKTNQEIKSVRSGVTFFILTTDTAADLNNITKRWVKKNVGKVYKLDNLLYMFGSGPGFFSAHASQNTIVPILIERFGDHIEEIDGGGGYIEGYRTSNREFYNRVKQWYKDSRVWGLPTSAKWSTFSGWPQEEMRLWWKGLDDSDAKEIEHHIIEAIPFNVIPSASGKAIIVENCGDWDFVSFYMEQLETVFDEEKDDFVVPFKEIEERVRSNFSQDSMVGATVHRALDASLNLNIRIDTYLTDQNEAALQEVLDVLIKHQNVLGLK